MNAELGFKIPSVSSPPEVISSVLQELVNYVASSDLPLQDGSRHSEHLTDHFDFSCAYQVLTEKFSFPQAKWLLLVKEWVYSDSLQHTFKRITSALQIVIRWLSALNVDICRKVTPFS